MTRYALSISRLGAEPLYLAASYEQTGSGICITPNAEDACSYVTFEKASSVAKALTHIFDQAPHIIEVEY